MTCSVYNMEWNELPCGKWTESHVSSWLKSIGVKEKYILKLYEEEVTGPSLMRLQREYLRDTIEMKGGQIELLLSNRNDLLKPRPQKLKAGSSTQRDTRNDESSAASSQESKDKVERTSETSEIGPISTSENEQSDGSSSSLSNFRAFDEHDKDFRYVKHRVLPPETGIENMIVPCHEYKSLEIAHKLEPLKLRVKVASEVIRFACGCMNMRTNGTIHFGVMDKIKGSYKHGEIIGIPVENQSDFVDALDYIENCFKDLNHHSDARKCIKNPKFIEVIDKGSSGGNWIIEFDIVPKARVVKNQLYSVTIPKFSEKTNRVIYEEKAPYHRVGANTPRIPGEDLVNFIQGLKEKDLQREEAESSTSQTAADTREDLGRKLSILLTCGKKYMDDTLSFIIVTNKFQEEHLKTINFLVHMKIFCVFDFDPDSKTSGLCGQYREHHAANLHFLHDFAIDPGLSTTDFKKSLQLFDRTSWIFCNGRNDYLGGEDPCDEKTWIRTKKKQLKRTVSVICNEILPKGSFVVLFLLMSQVEQPLVDTFHEFYAEMNGHEDLAIISESIENYNKWSSHAQTSCDLESLERISIVGMPMSHVDATIQSIQLSNKQLIRCLPVFNKGLCFLKPIDEDTMLSLDIVSADQCEETNLDVMGNDQVSNIEKYFYQGGKISWMHLWLAENVKCEEVIQRDAYKETTKILEAILQGDTTNRSIQSVNICHQPGSGGSTVAQQILWNCRTKLRCAVVKQSYLIETVCQHSVRLREYEEKDKNSCLPVLLLLDDCNAEYVDELRRELGNAIATMKINASALCFILLICKRCHNPEKMTRNSQTVSVTHNLSKQEKILFKKKRQELMSEPIESILAFVLMSEGFQKSYIEGFVKNLLEDIDHSSLTTRLIRFVALLNCHVQNSYISVSHCEASLGLGIQIDRFRYHTFVNSLSEQARLVFIQLRESTTHISSIKMHPLVAREILEQLSAIQPQSSIAKDLLLDKVLMDHRFGRDEFLKFLRDLLIRRNKISRGDPDDSSFSPLIEHVCREKPDGLQKATGLLEAAYTCFGKDAFVAQQLARLLYTNKSFIEAQRWAEEAKARCPHDTFILDTEGQVYKKWFYEQHDALGKAEKPPEEVCEIIGTALKGIAAFRASEKAPKSETVSLNSSYFGEVDVGCRLLQLISSVNVFSTKDGKSELMRYLLTDDIPEAVSKPWKKFHGQLKGLQKSIENALECISEDLSYFRTDISEEEEELDTREPEQVNNPRKWLTRKSAVYAGFFCNVVSHVDSPMPDCAEDVMVTPFKKQMKIYELGGGNVTTILSLLSDHKTGRCGKKLEEIISMYPENPKMKELDQTDLVNYIFSQIALACAIPGSPKLVALTKLQDLSMRFYREGSKSASAFFLLSILFWPEDNEPSSAKNKKVFMSAIEDLQRLRRLKIKPKKSRIVTHFFLGKARGLNRIVHRSAIEKQIKGNLTERRLKWLGGEVWKTPQVVQMLKRVEGWTENEHLFVQGKTKGSKIRVIPLYSASLPNANENVTFYLGFSFDGVVAFDIKVQEE
ncbi:sterile alpha motif domain-containing protein 9-like [Salmo trutta]|uniref:Sterile alpha motif domain-containing protein 9-like n=1 Tax=Salmo trutta TaxID=8032 RepID=A0A674E8V4_SALTR|nr:sterile alpha motif domain-containing protein 9-like [Salmo trutta]